MSGVTHPSPTPGPRPGPAAPAGPDLGELRTAFDDLLGDSAPSVAPGETEPTSVTDAQVEALDSAHELLAEALASLDAGR